jgi:ribonuclease BN (tRNA processing enzyme)
MVAGEENETEKGEDTNETNGKLINDVGCAVCLLGSGGGAPSTDRMTPATLIRMANRNMLVDVGEGTQRQLMYAAWPSSSISKLFITHMHGDHILGLPGLLLSAQQTQSQIKSQHKSLQIYGPPGLYNYIAMTLSLIHGHVSKVPITVYELVGGYQERGPNNRRHHRPNTPTASSSHHPHPTSLQKNVFLDWYPEFVIPNLTRVAIPRNLDGTWTLDHMGPDDAEHEEINSHDFTTEDGLYPTNLAKVLPLTRMAQRQSELDAMERKMRKKKRSHERGDGIYIGAAELQHVRGVQTFGYVMQEQVPLRNIDPDKALEEFGLEPSHKYKLLKMGQAVSRDDDPNVMVRPEQVWTPNQFRPRKIAILGDHCDISPAMAKLCMGADVLISEATLLPKNEPVSTLYIYIHDVVRMRKNTCTWGAS